LLIHSGTHGDESGVISPVREATINFVEKLPDFVFVPKVSPSAVRRRKRENANQRDLNRSFLKNTKEKEVLANMRIASRHKFDLCVSFHQDNEISKFYMYDSGRLDKNILNFFKRDLRKKRVDFFNGVDDPSDPTLNNKIKNGYISLARRRPIKDGTFGNWALANRRIKRMIEVEVPGRVGKRAKNAIVQSFFRDVILKII